jgi:gliding motility-associated-like protein
MKKILFLTLIWVICYGFKSSGQTPCIQIGIVPPILCPGNTFTVPFTLDPTNCCANVIRAEIDTVTGDYANPLTPPPTKWYKIFSSNVITIPLNYFGKYKVRLVCGAPGVQQSVDRVFEVDSLDLSPAPILSISQISPIRPSYCPADTLQFKINSITGAGTGFSINWGRNGTLVDGNVDSVFSVSDLLDNDVFYMLVTKQSRCAQFATAASDTFRIKVTNAPKVRIALKPGSDGCELSQNTFVAISDIAGLDPTYIWTRKINGRIDTLSKGINDTLFTLSPSDSATFGSQVCVEIIENRCKLKAEDCFTIKACGKVFIDPPIVPEVCAGTELKVPYTIRGSFLTGNVFRVQISDSIGNFGNPIDIGTLVSTRPDTIRTIVPANSNGGDFFRVRIISSLPIDTSDSSSTFKVFPKPITPITVSDSVCKSGLVTLSASSPQLGSIFQWYSGPFGGPVVFTGSAQTLNIARDTVFYISSVSSQGCESDRTQVRGIINPSPVVEAGPDLAKCVGDGPVTLTPFPLGGTWTGSLPVVNNVIDLAGVLPNTYTLFYEVINSLSCSTLDSFKLTLTPLPIVQVGSDTSFCSNVAPFQFSGSPAGGSWSGTGVQSDGTFVPSATGSGTFNLVYTASVNGCSASDTLKATVNLAPPIFTVTIVNPSACNIADGSATLAGITTGPGFKVKWSVDRTDSLSDPTISNLDAGSYSVVVTDLTSGCRRLGAFGLSDPSAPEPAISGLQANYCSSDPCVTMTVVPNSPTGTWSGTGVNGNVFCPDLADLGPNVVVYSYDTIGGCTGTTSFIVRVNQSPVVNAGAVVDSVCRNLGTFVLTGFSPPTPPAAWGPQPLVSSSGVVNLSQAVAGNNVVTISRALATCSTSASRTIFVYEDPEVTISKSPLNSVCLGSPVTLTANITNGVTATRFEWFKGNDIIPNENGNTLTITDSGSYTVSTTGLGLCKKTSLPIIIKFNSLPTNGVTPSGILSPCSNTPTVLTADSNPGYTYQWFGLDSIPNATGQTFTPNTSGQYKVKIRNNSGCVNFSDIITVNILDAPVAPIIAPPFSDTCLQAGQPVTITVGSSGGGLTFVWKKVGTPDRILAGSGPSITLDTSGSYYATVTAPNGCFALSDTINLKQTVKINIQDTIIEKCVGDNPFVVSGLSPTLGCRILSNGVPLENRIFTPSTPGNFLLTYECTNANGCISTRQLEVRVIPLPSANLSVQGATNVCIGDTVRLLVNDGVETGCSYQLFRNGVAFGSAVNTAIIPITQSGNYSALVTCVRCSTASNSIQITFNQRPVVNIGETIQGCSPLVTNLNVPGVSPGTWSGSPRITSTGDYNSGTFTGCDSVTLTVVGSGNLCTNFKKKVVCTNPIPNFSTSAKNASRCDTTDGSAWVVNGDQTVSYQWTRLGQTTVLSVNDSLLNVTPGVYIVRITNTFSLCFIERTVIINSPNNLTVLMGGLPSEVCANASPIQLIGNPTGGIFSSFGNRITSTSPDRFDPSLPGPLVDTIYYTINVNGCVGTTKKSIKINPLPVLDAGPNVSVCFGDTIVLRALQPVNQNLIWIGSQIENDSLYIASDPGITSSVATFGYTVNGCSNTASKTITVRPLPDFTLTTEDVSACGLSDGKVTVNILNPSQFQVIVRSIPTGTVIPPPRTNMPVGIYSVQVRNNTSSCFKTETFGISGPTNINPFVCLSNVPVSICQNEAPVTVIKCSPSASVYINGVATETINPAIYIPDNIGVILTDTDQNGCIGVEQKIVEIKAVPIVNVSGVGPLFACTNQNLVQLNGFFPAFNAIIPENGWTAPGQNPLLITRDGKINPSLASGPNPITLVYTAKNDNGCSAVKTVSFNVYSTPSAVITPVSNPTVCLGTCAPLSSQNIDPNYTYTWYLGPQPLPPPIGFGSSLDACLAGFYRLIVNNNGCKSSISTGVTVTTIPSPIIANIGSDVTICREADDFLIPTPVVIGTTTSEVWSAEDTTPLGFISPQGFVKPSLGNPGPNKVRFTVTNGNCSDIAFRTFNVIPDILAPITANGPTEICEGDKIELTANATGTDYSYEWTKDGIVIADSIESTLFVKESGVYNVRVIVNGIATCSKFQSAGLEVFVKPIPVVNISGDTLKVCFPSSTIDLNTVRPFLPLDAVWTSQTAGIVSPNGVLTPDNLTADGDYTLILTKTIGTCTSNRELIVRANKFPDPTFIQSAQAICNGDTVYMVYQNPNNYKTSWIQNGNVLVSGTNTNLIKAVTSGNYELKVNNNGCERSSSSNIEVKAKPNFNLRSDFSTCKNGEAIQLFPEDPTPGLGKWKGLGIDSATGRWNPNSQDVPVSGPIKISYIRTSDFGCVTEKSLIITVNPVPDIKLTSDNSVIEIKGPAIITASGGVRFDWSQAATLNQITGPVVSASPSETSTYTVRVTTDKGCIKDSSITIIVDEEFKIYDGFSPNGDKKNDTWIIKNIQQYPLAKVKVFNRWGNEVFESETGYPKPWDGTFNGDPVPLGAYYYIIDLGSSLTPKSGSVTIVR